MGDNFGWAKIWLFQNKLMSMIFQIIAQGPLTAGPVYVSMYKLFLYVWKKYIVIFIWKSDFVVKQFRVIFLYNRFKLVFISKISKIINQLFVFKFKKENPFTSFLIIK
jgi:hypothetical protein